MTALPIKSIKIPKENAASSCVCFVELYTTHEASQIYALLSTLTAGFVIDDFPISICYAKRNLPNSNAMNAGGLKNAASVALAAAQWTNQSEAGQSFPQTSEPSSSAAITPASNIQIVVPFNAPGKLSNQVILVALILSTSPNSLTILLIIFFHLQKY